MDLSPDEPPTNTDKTVVTVRDFGTGDEISSFTAKNPPIPARDDIMKTGRLKIEDGEVYESKDGLFRVIDRGISYFEMENRDTNESGLVTMVSLRVTEI